MKLKDINIQTLNKEVVKTFNFNNSYQGFFLHEREKDQLFFDNQKSEIEVFIIPLNENGETEVLVKDLKSDAIIDQTTKNQEKIQEALSKSEDQKTLEKRIQKIILSTYQANIDEAIEHIEVYRNELKEKEKKFYIVRTDGKPSKATFLESEENEYNTKIAGPFNTSEEADEFLSTYIDRESGQERKFNNPDYKYYIVSKDRILSGWEFKEDAMSSLKELPPVRRSESRVVSKRDMTVNAEVNENWGNADINESEILIKARSLFLERSLDMFSEVIEADKIKSNVEKTTDKEVLQWYVNTLMSRMSEARMMQLNEIFNTLNTEYHHATELLLSLK